MDRTAARAFLDRFIEMTTHANLIGVVAVADKSGLLSAMRTAGPLSTSDLAERAGLSRRYVAEALAALAAGGLVVFDASHETFHMPDEYASVLADESSPYFAAGWAQTTAAAMARVGEIADAFRNGGGVPYAAFGPDLSEGIDRTSAPAMRMFLNRKWLQEMPDVVGRLESGIRVADIGCGAGTATITMGEAYPHSTFFGFDLDERSIDRAQAAGGHLRNVEFHVAEAGALGGPPFDFVTTFDVIHDLADPQGVLNSIHELLAKDGTYLMVEPRAGDSLAENMNPIGALFYSVSTLSCLPVSLAYGDVGLGTAWGPARAEEMARRAGFGTFVELPIDNPTNAFYRLGN